MIKLVKRTHETQIICNRKAKGNALLRFSDTFLEFLEANLEIKLFPHNRLCIQFCMQKV